MAERPRNREEYAEYRKGEHWQALRAQALERAEYRCQLCYAEAGLDVHHRTYARLGNERVADLTVLCRSCHSQFHGVLEHNLTQAFAPPPTPRTRRWGPRLSRMIATDKEEEKQ